MAYLKTRAFVLKSVSYGENRRLLETLSREGEILTFSLRKSPGMSSSNAVSQPFVLADFDLSWYKDRYNYRGGDLVYAFPAVLQDWDKMAALSQLARIFLDVLRSQEAMPQAYTLWAFASTQLENSVDPLLDLRVAQMRFLADIGFRPNLTACARCGSEDSQHWRFDFATGSLLCQNPLCQAKSLGERSCDLSLGTISCLRYLISSSYKDLFKFDLSAKVRNEFIAFADLYLREVMEKDYPDLRFAEQLKAFGEDYLNS